MLRKTSSPKGCEVFCFKNLGNVRKVLLYRIFFTAFMAKCGISKFGMNPNKSYGPESGRFWLREKSEVVLFAEFFENWDV